jgi:hypothetical protein
MLPGFDASLNFLSKIFKNYVANQSGNDGNSEISKGEDIPDGESQPFSLTVCISKFTHQEVGIEQEDYETNFNQGPPNRGQFSGLFRIRSHLLTIARNH